METIAVDRFEGEYAVCEREDGASFTLPHVDLPKSTREGDVLKRREGAGWEIDGSETAKRRKAAKALLESLLYSRD